LPGSCAATAIATTFPNEFLYLTSLRTDAPTRTVIPGNSLQKRQLDFVLPLLLLCYPLMQREWEIKTLATTFKPRTHGCKHLLFLTHPVHLSYQHEQGDSSGSAQHQSKDCTICQEGNHRPTLS